MAKSNKSSNDNKVRVAEFWENDVPTAINKLIEDKSDAEKILIQMSAETFNGQQNAKKSIFVPRYTPSNSADFNYALNAGENELNEMQLENFALTASIDNLPDISTRLYERAANVKIANDDGNPHNNKMISELYANASTEAEKANQIPRAKELIDLSNKYLNPK